ncbi:phosphatidylinositol-glycan-specific phospholipase D [Protopterus annectens]|uniref:phosphatidylinositol-glycan-specific phospholipase D n=1 Tax=Protopterus annectens TaxID=7888 RepID=UPI001CFC3FE0|nr:phosphatidylinositol-glycan-specific phospholipase D [Protopterus annectens]
MSCLHTWLHAFTLSFILWKTCNACGISTHTEIGHRAQEFFNENEGGVNYKELIQKHLDAYQAGALYPDSFYPIICKSGKFHQVSEDTHWTPFLKVMINYIRNNYPKPWDTGTEKLVVFLLGIASHMVSDVTWHNLGIKQGFLYAMGAVDFHGSFSQAHTAGDFGGDVIALYQLNFDYVQKAWYVPVKDLVEVHKEYYGHQMVDEATITECSSFQYLGLMAEQLLIDKLFPMYAKKSLFLVDRYSEYFFGGVDDMAYWTTKVMRQTVKMLENGTGECSLPENPLFIDCEGKKQDNYMEKKSEMSSVLYINSSFINMMPVLKVVPAERGVYFELQTWAKDTMQYAEKSSIMETVNSLLDYWNIFSRNTNELTASYYVTTPYARLGWTMITADLNQDGYEDLVIGAPGYSQQGNIHLGRIYVVYNTGDGLPSDSMDLDIKADVILEGLEPSGRFGSSVAVLDFNRDGIMDIAVGAPSVGAPDRTYNGHVYVYFGSRERGLGIQNKPSIVINCSETFCNLGWKLLAADMDKDGADDLVTASPYSPGGGSQRGMVAAFYSKTNVKGLLTIQDADWIVTGEHDYSWFGYSLHCDELEGRTLLVIGSPSWRICKNLDCSFSTDDIQNVGKIYGFYPPKRVPEFAVLGNKEGARVGSSIASGHVLVDGAQRRVLLVGAPTYDSISVSQAGQVLLYELTADKGISQISTFTGDKEISRFGEAVHLSDLDNDGTDDVIITSPIRAKDGIIISGEEEGRVYIFNGTTLTTDCKRAHRSWISSCPQAKAQYELKPLNVKSRFGNAVVSVKSKTKNQVLVAAERSSMQGHRLTGAVHLYSF